MRTMTTVAATPGQNGMKVQYLRATDPDGVEIVGSVATYVAVVPAYGVAGAARFSRAGIVAALAAANTSVAALSAANADLINESLPGGLAIEVGTWCVRVPCLQSGVAALAATLNTLLGTAANVVVLT
jgi:hypothetical protein